MINSLNKTEQHFCYSASVIKISFGFYFLLSFFISHAQALSFSPLREKINRTLQDTKNRELLKTITSCGWPLETSLSENWVRLV